MKKLRNETRSLPVHLDDQQVLERSVELTHTIQAIEVEEDAQSALKTQMKANMAGLVAKQSRLASVVANRLEFQDVTVEILFSPDAAPDGVVQEVRVDTAEILKTRGFRDDERQLALEQEGKD